MHFIELIGRIFLSFLFLFEGIKKIFFFQEETQMYMEEYGIPEILFYPSALLEIILPIFIIIGFKTQFCASIMVVFTISVTIIFHMDFNNQMQLITFLNQLMRTMLRRLYWLLQSQRQNLLKILCLQIE